MLSYQDRWVLAQCFQERCIVYEIFLILNKPRSTLSFRVDGMGNRGCYYHLSTVFSLEDDVVQSPLCA